MEDLNFIQGIASYGGIGACCLYFMLKDWTLNKKITDALTEFTVAVRVLSASIKGGDSDASV